ncbi:MAG: sigma-70 family RNA polymerase sigma factor [Verrucomicrobia bacterium]|nr:sigma-70 family RNA polymerase sigma factor [Verrucomicrobiota bacterium]
MKDQSFEILVNTYKDMVFCFARGLLNDPGTAEDVAQEAFVVAYKNMAKFDASRDFGAWIRGIVRKLALRKHG